MENKTLDIKKILYSYILPVLLVVLSFGTILYYIIGPMKGYMTSDCTDSLRWGYETYKSGKLINNEFYYAAVQPFGGNLFFLPFVAIFGYTLSAQIWGLSFFLVMLYLSIYYFFKSLKVSRNMSLVFNTIFIFIMAASPKLREIMFEHIFYYNLGILFFLLGFGLTLRIIDNGGFKIGDIKNDKKEKISFFITIGLFVLFPVLYVIAMPDVLFLLIITILLVLVGVATFILPKVLKLDSSGISNSYRILLLIIFSLITATDGLQTLITFTLPVMGALLIMILSNKEEDGKFFSSTNKNMITVLLLVFVSSVVGYLSLMRASNDVTAGYQNAYSTLSPMNEWLDNFLNIPHNFLTLIGVTSSGGDSLISELSIINMIKIFGVTLLLILPIVALFKFKEFKNSASKIVIIGHFIVSLFILYACIFGSIGNANWRLTPMLGTSVIASIITLYELLDIKPIGQRFSYLLLIFMTVFSLLSFIEIIKMDNNYEETDIHYICAKELEERNLKYGAANFWFSEEISMISNTLEVTNIKENESSPIPYRYQVNERDYMVDTDQYFILLTESENRRFSSYILSSNPVDSFTIDAEYNIRGYSGEKMYVYIYDNNILK